MTQVRVVHKAQIIARLLAIVGRTHTQRNVLHQLVLLVPKTRWLDSHNLQIVLHHVRSQRIHNVRIARRNQQQPLVLLYDWFQYQLKLQDVADLHVGHQHHHILVHALVLLLIVDKQRAQIPPVNLQPQRGLGNRLSALALLNRNNTILPHVLVNLRNDLTNALVVVRRNRSHVRKHRVRQLLAPLLQHFHHLLTHLHQLPQQLRPVQ